MAQTGAAYIFSMFFASRDLASRALPMPEVTNTKRAGQPFMLVGPFAVMP